jgi:predicted PurR-regulated permease PerM
MPVMLRDGVENVFDGVSGVIWGYMRNQVIISAIFGLASGVAYIALGLPYASLLGILAGVLNMIPYFGSIISGLVAILVAVFYFQMNKVLLTAFVIVVLNIILGNILTPKIQAKALGIHPVVVITALLVCNHLWGAVGMFVAVPLVGLGRLVMKELIQIIRAL